LWKEHKQEEEYKEFLKGAARARSKNEHNCGSNIIRGRTKEWLKEAATASVGAEL